MLAKLLSESKVPHQVSVATDYGARIEYEACETDVLIGRKDKEEIAALLQEEQCALVVDATHPFAAQAHEEIRKACLESGTEYLRLMRPVGRQREEAVYADTIEEAAAALNGIEGRLFLLTGTKDLDRLLSLIEDRARVYVRILPEESSIRKCMDAGLSGKQIIAMQGPFSEEMNIAFLKDLGIGAILTKESGEAGGFEEKLSAAAKCGVKAVVLKNPESRKKEEGLSFSEVLKRVEDRLGIRLGKAQKRITLAGAGPGEERLFTGELRDALAEADVLFGAESVLNRVSGNQRKVFLYEGEKIHTYLEEHPSVTNPVAVFSGDISLCSGAGKAERIFLDRGYEVRKIPGLSSVALFASRLSLSLDEVRIISVHGRERNVCGFVRKTEHVIVLPSGPEQANELFTRLFETIPDLVSDGKIVAGIELGTEREQVYEVKPGAGVLEKEGRILLYIHDPKAKSRPLIPAVSDHDLKRGAVPMTKEEIRGLSLRKLGLTEGAVFYDIGAGTGSVSVEAALLHPDIEVFSIEKKEEALVLLRANRERFGLSNMEVIKGEAPEILEGVKAPTHAFIGGSGGRLSDILSVLSKTGERIRIVLNIITPETLSEGIHFANDLGFETQDIMSVQVTKYEKTGAYHLPKANNPVYIVTLERGGSS